jgi:hypothetical protein
MGRASLAWAAVVAAVVLAVPGCGGGGKVAVKGTVTLDGQPVEGAMVAFVPADPGKGEIAYGTTDKDGTFRLTTTKPNDGAVPGEYKVTVVYAEAAEAPPAQGMKEAFEGLQKARAQQRTKPPKYNVPAKYGDPARSDLRQTVPPRDGQVTLDLKSK